MKNKGEVGTGYSGSCLSRCVTICRPRRSGTSSRKLTQPAVPMEHQFLRGLNLLASA